VIVTIKRIVLEGDEAIKWLVLEGSCTDCPQATQRVTIDTASLAAGRVSLDDIKNTLTNAVMDAATRYQAVQDALAQL
jgi:hypothetical protein